MIGLSGEAVAQPGATEPQPPQPQPYPPQPYSQPLPPPPPAARRPKHLLCFAGRPYKCASTLLVELGGRATKDVSVTIADFGLLVHNGLDAYGATVGITHMSNGAEDINVFVAGRYRRYLGTWGFAADVSVGYAGGPAVEVALGWADVLAVTAGVNSYELADGGRDTLAAVGLRIGSVTIGGAFYVAAMLGTTWASSAR